MKKLFIVYTLLCAIALCYADAVPPSVPPPPPRPGETLNASEFNAEMSELSKNLSLAKTNTDKALILFQMGNMCLMQNKNAEARTYYDKVLAMDQVKPYIKAATWMSYADSYFEEGNYHETRAAYNKILSMTNVPTSFPFYAQRKKIEAYLSDKQYAKARTESGKLHAYKKSYPVVDVIAAYYIGESYLGEGHFNLARKQFDKTQKFNEGDISNTNLQQENSDLLEIYQQQALLGIALSYFNQKQYSKAKEEYTKIVQMNRWGKFKTEAANEIKVIEKMQAKRE